MPVPKDYANETCKLGQREKCCRYLGADSRGLYCLKNSEFHDLLDTRAKEKTMSAQADNCEGWQDGITEVFSINFSS